MNSQTNATVKRPSVAKLEEKIGHTFRDDSLLETALTHSSYSNERHNASPCYERLEFLGDSILGFITAEFLYRHDPPIPEGRMTRLRAELVCEQSLYGIALELDLGRYMRLGRGEENSGGRQTEREAIRVPVDKGFLHPKRRDRNSAQKPQRQGEKGLQNRAAGTCAAGRGSLHPV